MKLPVTLAWAVTSAAAIGCDQLSNPYEVAGSSFGVICNSYSTGGNQIGPSFEVIVLETCIQLCAETTDCHVALFDRSQYLCYLMDGTDGPVPNNLYEMAILIPSTPSTPTTSEALPATTSSAPTQAPLSCTQMAGSIYSEKFAISCDTISTGESVYRRDEEDSFENCLAKCDNDVRCIAVNFYPYPYSECDLIESFAGTRPSDDVHFASKVISTSSTASTSSESIQPTSMSSSMLSSDLSESTSEAISTSTALLSAPEPTTDTSTTATASIDNTTSLGMSTFETSTTKTSTTETPVVETSTSIAPATTTLPEGAGCRRRRRSQR